MFLGGCILAKGKKPPPPFSIIFWSLHMTGMHKWKSIGFYAEVKYKGLGVLQSNGNSNKS